MLHLNATIVLTYLGRTNSTTKLHFFIRMMLILVMYHTINYNSGSNKNHGQRKFVEAEANKFGKDIPKY